MPHNNLNVCEKDVNDIEHLICNVAALWRRLLNQKIKSLGISGIEKRVLFCIACYPGLTQVQVAKMLELEPQNLIRFLDKLESLGWLEKRINPEDRRVKCLHVTAEAKHVISQIKTIGSHLKPEILAGIQEDVLQSIVMSLASIRTNLLAQIEFSDEGGN